MHSRIAGSLQYARFQGGCDKLEEEIADPKWTPDRVMPDPRGRRRGLVAEADRKIFSSRFARL